ncbi:putative cDENN domain-containing protein [Helianthus annuus]|nr:putative cDENN domain-containing protein [Helianthus annuus]
MPVLPNDMLDYLDAPVPFIVTSQASTYSNYSNAQLLISLITITLHS